MKLFFIKISIILSLFLIIFILLNNWSQQDKLDKYSNSNETIQTIICKDKFDSLDVLFVGNSYSYSGIYANMFDTAGLKVFNLGIAASGVYFYDLLVNDYLKSCKKVPKTICFVISPMTFSKKSDDFIAYPIHRYLNQDLTNIEITKSYQLYSSFFSMTAKSLRKSFQNQFSKSNLNHQQLNCSEKGFIKNDKIADSLSIVKDFIKYQSLKNEQFDLKKSSFFINNIKLLQSKSIEVMILELPTNQLNSCFNETYLEQYEAFWKIVSMGFNNVYRIPSEHFSKEHYRDIDHLNTNGAIFATQKIIQKLK